MFHIFVYVKLYLDDIKLVNKNKTCKQTQTVCVYLKHVLQTAVPQFYQYNDIKLFSILFSAGIGVLRL